MSKKNHIMKKGWVHIVYIDKFDECLYHRVIVQLYMQNVDDWLCGAYCSS